jgi:transcriptional/translational regulatory protein YebC/TACO1
MEALLAANADAEDIGALDQGQVSITAAPQQFDAVAKALAAARIAIASSDITKLPDNQVSVDTLAQGKAVQELLEALDDQDDVQGVFHNAEFSEEVAAQL